MILVELIESAHGKDSLRLIKQAVDAKKPVMILSVGPTRADGLPGVDKIEMRAGPILEEVLSLFMKCVRAFDMCTDTS